MTDIVMTLDLYHYLSGRTRPELVLEENERFTITYAPFDYVSQRAEIVLVGLTPGRAQAYNALASFQAALRSGKDYRTRCLRRLEMSLRPGFADRWPHNLLGWVRTDVDDVRGLELQV